MLKMDRLNSKQQIKEYLMKQNIHIFHLGPLIGTTFFDLIKYIPNFTFIACGDIFNQQFSNIYVPRTLMNDPNHTCVNKVVCVERLLRNSEVIEYMKARDNSPNALFQEVHPRIEEICRNLNINIWATTSQIYLKLGDKVQLTKLLKEIGISHLPSICAPVSSYSQLKEIAPQFFPQLVIQTPQGFSGSGTLYINNEDDFLKYEAMIKQSGTVKIMPFKRLTSFSIQCILTRCGTFVGPLFAELIGFKELTNFRGGFCGNQFKKSYLGNQEDQKKMRKQIFDYSEKLGDYLYKNNLFKGFLGLDFVMDLDNNEIFLMQINPRLTGNIFLTPYLQVDSQDTFPPFIYHCLQFLNIDFDIDPKPYNNYWMNPTNIDFKITYFKPHCTNHQEEGQLSKGIFGYFQENEDGVYQWKSRWEMPYRKLKLGELLFIPCVTAVWGHILIFEDLRDEKRQLTPKGISIIEQITKVRRCL